MAKAASYPRYDAARLARRSAGDLLAQLLDLGLLAAEIAEVVELRPPDITLRDDLDTVQYRRVQRIGPLHADAEADLPDREGFTEPVTLATDHHALEDLDTGAVALDHPGVHLHGVPGAEHGQVGPLRLGVK